MSGNEAIRKRVAGSYRALYSIMSLWRRTQVKKWHLRKLMFKVMVQTMALYACPIWAPGLARARWKELEQIQKRFLLEELGAKAQTPYEMLLAEAGLYPLEVEALFQTLTYLKRIQIMDVNRIPVQALLESQKQENGWYTQLIKWAECWGIHVDSLPDTEIGLRELVTEQALLKLWPRDDEEIGVKREFYRSDVNPMLLYTEQDYLKELPGRKTRRLISQFRLSSHHLQIEIGRMERPKVPRELRFCKCCFGGVEDEYHALLTCDSFRHLRSNTVLLSPISTLYYNCPHGILEDTYASFGRREISYWIYLSKLKSLPKRCVVYRCVSFTNNFLYLVRHGPEGLKV